MVRLAMRQIRTISAQRLRFMRSLAMSWSVWGKNVQVREVVAQAQQEGLTAVSRETEGLSYPVVFHLERGRPMSAVL